MATSVVVSVGDELLAGDVADTNAAEIAQALRAEGIATRGFLCVGDRAGDIRLALLQAAAAADVVLVTGGLGPTKDDLTREGLAAALGEPLVLDPPALLRLEAWFRRAGRAMPESNRAQACRPASAELLDNDLGTAPGLSAKVGAAHVFAVPGVPREMRHLLKDQVLPRLRAAGLCGAGVRRILVRAHGLPESVAGERIADLMGEDRDPLVGITVADGVLTVCVSSLACPFHEVEAVALLVEARLGEAVFGRDSASLEQAVQDLLRGRGWRLAIAESMTGGLVARLLTRVAGASSVFVEGAVTYSNEAKVRRLGVTEESLRRHGAVSDEVAREMALGMARSAGVEVAAGITGIAGPTGATAQKPVGLVFIGLSVLGEVTSHRVVIQGDREYIQLRAARVALDLLRRAVRA